MTREEIINTKPAELSTNAWLRELCLLLGAMPPINREIEIIENDVLNHAKPKRGRPRKSE